MSQFNRLVVVGSDIIPSLQCQRGVNILLSAPFPREVSAESRGLRKHELLEMKAFLFLFVHLAR